MKKSIFKKIGGLFLGLAMGLGVAAGVTAGNKVSEVKAVTSTYQHVFNAKPGTGNNVTLSGISWTVSATNLNGYNNGNYAGVQVGAKSSAGNISLTSNAAFSYDNKSVIKEIHIWLNTGGTAVSYSASVGGVACTSDGTTVTKNSTAKADWTLTSDCKLTPSSTSNKGVVNITASSSAGPAFYICAIQIIVDEEAAAQIPYSYNLGGATGTTPASGTKEAGTSLTLASAPSWTGHTFNGWSDGSNTYAAGSSYTMPTSGSVTFTAQWTTNTYTVSGTIGNGELSSTSSVSYGSQLNITINPNENYTCPETLTLVTMGGSTLTVGSGYTYDNSTGAFSIASVTGNVVINATCVPLGTSYTVTYNANGGSVSTTSEEIIENGNPSFPVPTKNGFQFKGWQINGSGTAYTNPNDYLVTQDVEFVALWEAIAMESLTVNYTGGKPYLGEKFTFAGTIEANMSDGSQESVAISDVDFEVDPYIITQQTVTATHKTTGVTGTFNVQYQAKSYTTTTTEQKTLIVHASDVGGTNNSYALKDWTVDGVSGKSYTYASTSAASSFQFNGSKGTNIFYNTSAISGKIKSVKMTKSSGTDRGGVEVFVHTSAMTSSNYTSGTSLGSKTVTTSGVTWDVPATNTNNNVYLYVHYPTTSALYVSQVEITYEKTTTVPSSEKHAIRIGEVTCNKSPLIAGETISKSDFKIQVQYDTGTALTSNLTPTSVSPTTLVAGTHDYTITYTGSYNDTVTKVVQLTAQAPAVLESISITKDAGCDDVFTRNDTFTHNGIHVIAHYTDSTTYPDADVTANADITPPSDMNVAGTKTINVSYEENDVTKTTSYQITVNPIVSTYLALSGEGIEGSNGVYTLKSGVENEVQLSFDKDGDEEIEFTNPTSFLSFDKSTSLLTINSQTTTSESGTITFTAGSLTASLTVNVSAAEGIQLISDEEIVGYVGSSFSYNISIQLDNVESATWTLPQGDFVIESEIEDNTGFVGTIYFTDEVLDTLTFSVLTGKGETLSVDIEVLAVNDEIKSISASLKSGVTYTAGQGQTFSKDDLTVKFVRDSGANGTLLSSEFTVSGAPEGSFNRVASYPLTITSVENTEATCSLTINVGMSDGENLVTSTSTYVPGQPTLGNATVLTYSSNSTAGIDENDGFTTAGIKNNKTYNALLTTGSTITKQNAFTGNVGQITLNFNAWTATVGSAFTYTLIAIDSDGNETTYSTAGVEFTPTTSSTAQAAITVDIPSTNTKSITGWKISVVKGGDTSKGNCSFSDLSVSYKTWTPGQGTYNTTYTNNAMTATIYNFIALANETYADICGSEGNNQKPDSTTWRSVLESDEYEKLVADSYSYNLLKSAICGEGAYGSNGVYVASGEKQSSDMVIEFLEKYDRVVSNYPSENYNYLGRDVSSSGSRINPILALSNIESSTWIIAVIAVSGLTAIGGYFFYKKRKENY